MSDSRTGCGASTGHRVVSQIVGVLAVTAMSATAHAQAPPPAFPLTLQQAIRYATDSVLVTLGRDRSLEITDEPHAVLSTDPPGIFLGPTAWDQCAATSGEATRR